MWRWLLALLGDSRGEDAGQGGGPGDAGSGDAPPAGGSGEGEGGGEGGQGGEGEGGGAGSGTPKYGEFGDSPTVDKLFEAINSTRGEFDNFRKKAGLTEANLGKIRQQLATAGLEIGEDGTVRRKESADRPKSRFTDTHKSMFEPRVLEAMQALLEDTLDNRFSRFTQQSKQQQYFERTLHESIDKMYTIYPQLRKEMDGKANPEFNQAFFERANAILQEKYSQLPNGDLIAAHEAAMELRISPIALEQARKDGFNKGAGAKRVLGPAKGSGASATPSGKLSKEEYMKLSPEEKAEHDKKYVLS